MSLARALALFALDPAGCGGAALRGRAGPAREAALARLRALLPQDTPVRRLPASIDDSRLMGGLDLAATLSLGRPVALRGLLAEADGGVVVAPMAERMPPSLVSRVAAAMDTGEARAERDGLSLASPARFGLVALDEGVDDEILAEALRDRLAFHLACDAWRDDEDEPAPDAQRLAQARQLACMRLPKVGKLCCMRLLEREEFTGVRVAQGGESVVMLCS